MNLKEFKLHYYFIFKIERHNYLIFIIYTYMK